MEQKKFDINSFIGMILLGGIMLWWVNTQKPKVEPEETSTTEQVIENTTPQNSLTENTTTVANDSLQQITLRNQLGAFAHSAINGKEGETVIENRVLQLTISNKGGQITKALIKNFKTYDSLPLYLIKDKNASFNINFGTFL